MVYTLETSRISELREIAKMTVNEEPVSEATIESAKEILRFTFQEASGYGLSEAEVIKAILRPVIGPKPRGCNCFTCKHRRGDVGTNTAVEVRN